MPPTIALDDEYEAEEEVASEAGDFSDEEIRAGLAQPLVSLVAAPVGSAPRKPETLLEHEHQAAQVEVSVHADVAFELHAWFRRAVASCPHAIVPTNWPDVLNALLDLGAPGWEDFVGTTAEEAVAIWAPLADLDRRFLLHLWTVLAVASRARPAPADPPQLPVPRILPFTAPPPGGVKRSSTWHEQDPMLRQFSLSMQILRTARRLQVVPPPTVLAQSLRMLSRLPDDAVQQRWLSFAGGSPPALPAARATWMQKLQCSSTDLEDALVEDTIWRCFCSWRRSGLQYAVAVDLWGRASATCARPPWPPTSLVLSAFASYFRNGRSLQNYLSHIRTVLRLLNAPIGILAETDGVVRGSIKATPHHALRYRARASAIQTRMLVQHARSELDRTDLADSWVVARHFCLRYGSEVIPLEGRGMHSTLQFETSSLPVVATVVLKQRKMHSAPVSVVRRCICKLQGRSLCGVCILQRRWCATRIFPTIVYADALALLKVAAEECDFDRESGALTHSGVGGLMKP